MPTHMPSSFASAAAGQGSNRQPRGGRSDGGSGDWSRKDTKSSNGVLFRRSSTAPQNQPQSSDEAPLPTPTAENPSQVYESSNGSRYSKSQLLDIYTQLENTNGDVGRLYENQWDPGHSNGTNGRGWGKSNDTRDTNGPDLCWAMTGDVGPISLQEMTVQEKEDFAGDVNSPLKPPPQNAAKDANATGNVNGRKTSLSHGQGNNFGLPSPASSRPGTRRRETSDSVTGGLGSPAGTGRFPRDESSPFFSRKATDREGPDEHENKPNTPFGTLLRSNTTTSALGNGSSSPWAAGPTTGAMSPMGTFGSFALPGSSSIPPTPNEKRPPFGSIRGESRLAHLMPEKNAEETAAKLGEKSWRSRPRTDTDPFGDDSTPAGSAALGGGQDESPPANRRTQGLDTPVKGNSSDFGMSEVPGFPGSHLRGQNQPISVGQHGDHEPLSPDTNPYRSPPDHRGERNEGEEGGFETESLQSRVQSLGGIPEYGGHPFSNLSRGFPNSGFDGSDRSQTSSVNGSRAFPSLGGLPSLGALGGWPASGNPMGTPDPQSRSGFPSAFGNSLFGPMGDLQSPSLGGLGGVFGPGSGPNTTGRGSKLGSLFPAAMQAQMQGHDSEPSESGDMRQGAGFGAIGRNAFTPRESDSPVRGPRHLEDLFTPNDSGRGQGPFSSADNVPSQTTTAFQNQVNMNGPGQSGFQQPQTPSESASNQLPTAQQRMMVMPDRMRWVYLDPQGQVQGPWSGLEMHDWYKASFFTADLSVKKVEDAEFEPLGQLIRRIGNSREPFLVPQIGIPHGPATTQPASSFSSAQTAAAQPGAVQPPFAGAFPSFGTTLTAEQQNNLERRKQEEQYLMARQREFLAQQQVNMKQMQMSGLPSALHHQSSIHSLQSQPSFGSMTSPIGMPPQAGLASVGFPYDAPRQPPVQGAGIPFDTFREDELARLSLQDRQQLFNAVPQPPQNIQAQQVPQPYVESVGQQSETSSNDQRQSDPQGFKARLQEFEQLRAQHDAEEAAQAANAGEPAATPEQADVQSSEEPSEEPSAEAAQAVDSSILSLTQQVQKAASAKQSPIPESPWAKVNTSLPMPFPPPPQSTTPLPAPTAQRSRTNLPEALNVQSRSRSETPEVVSVTPSLAPWAKEQTEASKGPSLKEIQEAEAKKAAKAEEIAAAARRALHEQEMKQLAAQPAAPAPGLPTTSTWANSSSPATPASVPSAWVKPAATKVPAASTPTLSKKTLADIQREEELRKQKLAATVAAATPSVVAAGKRYADLASKQTAAAVPGPAWSTVGAGGKVKAPTGPAATIAAVAAAAPIPQRSASTTGVSTPTVARVTRPASAARSVTTTGQTTVASANEELIKWAKGALAKDLNSEMNVDQFVQMLLTFPLEVAIISESIYSVSMLIDGRRFAEEFIRRRKLADKGIVEPANVGSGSGFSAAEKSGGWSEVAKKGPPKEEPTAGFKVVPNKKKGKK
ncbi:GYF protein [Coleophoma cylindrospora]|uniref:GYF protein n=1 Tax=Coleophoma cylindrospora TaxID=1849047 RepID=A0A3D8R5S0_9HELO|nr:GYF protein [Coleophoma cylindrospora]